MEVEALVVSHVSEAMSDGFLRSCRVGRLDDPVPDPSTETSHTPRHLAVAGRWPSSTDGGGAEEEAEMELILLRHGEPHVTGGGVGAADPGLGEAGRVAAEAVGRHLALESPDVVVASPLRRAIETAEILCHALGVEYESVDGLAEFDREAGAYVTVDAMKESGDPRFEQLLRGDLTAFGTDRSSFLAGVVQTCEALIKAWPGRRVVAVCHGGVINAYLAHVLELRQLLRFEIAYASITRVVASRSGLRSVRSVNETAHLRA